VSRDRAFKLRFEISAEDHDRLRAIFFAPDAAEVEKSRILSVYLDTPDAVLHEQDLIWCFSRKDKFRDSRLKTGEWRLDSESDARSFVKKNRLRDRIGGAFTMRVDRELVLHRRAQVAIEISLERTSLRNGDQSATLSEAQFTLRDGEAEELVRLVSEVLPQAVPATASMSYIERGYALGGVTSPPPSGSDSSKLDKTMRVADAFRLIAREETNRALAALDHDDFGLTRSKILNVIDSNNLERDAGGKPLHTFPHPALAPQDAPSIQQNIHAVRRIQSAFRFFAGSFDAQTQGPDARPFTQLEAALEKAYDLDRILTDYVRPAALRGRWDGVSSLIARVEENRTRAYSIFAQSWPAARVKNLFAEVSAWLDTQVPASVAGSEALSAYLARELTKAVDEIQVLGANLQSFGMAKARAEDLHPLAEAVGRLQEVVSFFEPLATGKAFKRWTALQDALSDLKALLDKEYQLAVAQSLIADAASHIARLKQTKTQAAHLYAAGALAGFMEALKEEGPEKALKEALTALSEVKPFWAKID
jgi:inorganic triphosphatase YgiF